MSHLRPGWRAPAIGLLAIGLLAGCSGSSGLDSGLPGSASPGGRATSTSPADPSASSSASPTTAASTAASVDPNAAAKATVAADLDTYFAAFTKSLRIRNARVTDLIRYSTASRQARDRTNIANMRARGIVLRGTPKRWVGSMSVAGNRATVHFCERDDTSWFEYASSGQLVGDRLDKWEPYEMRLLQRDSRWQVNLVTPSKKVSCKDAT